MPIEVLADWTDWTVWTGWSQTCETFQLFFFNFCCCFTPFVVFSIFSNFFHFAFFPFGSYVPGCPNKTRSESLKLLKSCEHSFVVPIHLIQLFSVCQCNIVHNTLIHSSHGSQLCICWNMSSSRDTKPVFQVVLVDDAFRSEQIYIELYINQMFECKVFCGE